MYHSIMVENEKNWEIAAMLLLKLFTNGNARCHTMVNIGGTLSKTYNKCFKRTRY